MWLKSYNSMQILKCYLHVSQLVLKKTNRTSITKGYNFSILLVLTTFRAGCIKVAVSQQPLSRLTKHNCWQNQWASQTKISRESSQSAGISKNEWQCWGFIFIPVAISSGKLSLLPRYQVG